MTAAPRPASTTAHDLIEALRRHHEPPPRKPVGGYFVTEIQAPGSNRRADALWAPVNTASRGRIIGYETKVSRADVVAELRDPLKADAWERYCDQWWLVIPRASLVDGLDVPERWGILTPPTATNRRRMTIVRQAPQLAPTGDPREALGTILAKLVYGGDSIQQRLTSNANTIEWQQDRLKKQDEELRRLRLTTGTDAHYGRVRVADVLAELQELEKTTGAWLALYDLDAAAIARHIVTAASTSEVHREIDRMLRSAHDALRHAGDKLAKVSAGVTATEDPR